MNELKRLVGEIHRRSLWQVLGIYLAGSWAALEATDMLAGSAGLPEWFPSVALGLLIVGLPIVLATAVVQEGMGGSGRPREDAAGSGSPSAPATASPSSPRRLLTWRNALLGGGTAFALWGVVAAGWLALGGPRSADTAAVPAAGGVAQEIDAAKDRRSVAVLPFETRSAVLEDSFFSQGVHEDIMSQLARIEALKVISRTSVMQYADADTPIGRIATELGVATVLEGSVQRAGNRIRVTATLIDAATDAHLWNGRYDEALTTENIFAIQTQIARAIADALEARLTGAEAARIARRPTENLEAYDLYNRGRYLWAQATVEPRLEALDLYRQATELDPGFAAAHALLGGNYVYLTAVGDIPRTPEGLASARASVERALDLDPDLAEAHAAHGSILESVELDFDGAERAYQRAIETSPGSADFHHALAGLYLGRGRFDAAREEFQRAIELDPLAILPRANLSFVEFVSRDFAAAEQQASRVVELDPDHYAGYYMLGGALSFQDRHEEALAAVRRSVERDTANLAVQIILGYVHARAGNRDSALVIANQVEERGGSLKEIALVHGALGNIDRAFEYLERALARDPGQIAALDIDPSADPLRDDPRYHDILRRAGLE